MRIAHVLAGRCNPDSANGIDKVVYHLSRCQAALGHDVGVWGISTRPPLPIDGVRVKTTPPALVQLFPPPGIIDDLVTFRPDVVHLHFVFSPPMTAIGRALQSRGIPYVVTPHGGLAPNAIRQRPVRKAIYGLLLEKAYLNRASALHAVCDGEVTDIKRYGVSAPVFVAPHGVDLLALGRDADAATLGELFPEAVGKRVFLYFGRLAIWQKGLDLLIEAVGLAKADMQGAVVVLVGPDWRGNRARIEQQIATAGLEGLIKLAGPRFGQEKLDVLAGADVVVLPSRWDVLPTGLLEAMALGKPCLITEATNLGSFVRRFDAGLVVEPHPAHIAAGLQDFMRMDAATLRAMTDRVREATRQEFNWESTTRLVIEHYPNKQQDPLSVTGRSPAVPLS